MKVDAHQHFWKYSAREYPFLGNEMATIHRDFFPEELEENLDAVGLDGSVVVQARQSLAESRWLMELAERHRRIFGVVGWVDLVSENVEDELRRFAGHAKFVGVRHVVQDEPDDAFMLRDDFRSGIASLKNFGLTYDILVYPRQLPAAIKLAQEFPEQPFVLDHIGKPNVREGELESWRDQIRALAAHGNVYCKVSGLVTEADWKGWQENDFDLYLDVVWEAFGEDRLMFGSDWPICLVAASYEEVFGIIARYLERIGASKKTHDKIFGANAARFYGLGG